ncbi:hypothetical protein EZS27_026685, partial [termite gut metagenome]
MQISEQPHEKNHDGSIPIIAIRCWSEHPPILRFVLMLGFPFSGLYFF